MAEPGGRMKVAIIPARGGSKRIPDKNITDFLGAPLMSYSIRAAEESELFDRIHVSTDSERIADVAERLGHPVDFMRDPNLADDHTPLLPVLKWTLEQYHERGCNYDAVCLVYPTAPLIEADDLKQADALFQQWKGERIVMAVSRFNVPVEWAFHLDDDGTLQALQPGMGNIRSQDIRPTYYDTGTFMFLPAKDILSGAVDEKPIVGFPLARHKAVDIDDAEDLQLAKVIFRGLHNAS